MQAAELARTGTGSEAWISELFDDPHTGDLLDGLLRVVSPGDGPTWDAGGATATGGSPG